MASVFNTLVRFSLLCSLFSFFAGGLYATEDEKEQVLVLIEPKEDPAAIEAFKMRDDLDRVFHTAKGSRSHRIREGLSSQSRQLAKETKNRLLSYTRPRREVRSIGPNRTRQSNTEAMPSMIKKSPQKMNAVSVKNQESLNSGNRQPNLISAYDKDAGYLQNERDQSYVDATQKESVVIPHGHPYRGEKRVSPGRFMEMGDHHFHAIKERVAGTASSRPTPSGYQKKMPNRKRLESGDSPLESLLSRSNRVQHSQKRNRMQARKKLLLAKRREKSRQLHDRRNQKRLLRRRNNKNRMRKAHANYLQGESEAVSKMAQNNYNPLRHYDMEGDRLHSEVENKKQSPSNQIYQPSYEETVAPKNKTYYKLKDSPTKESNSVTKKRVSKQSSGSPSDQEALFEKQKRLRKEFAVATNISRSRGPNLKNSTSEEEDLYRIERYHTDPVSVEKAKMSNREKRRMKRYVTMKDRFPNSRFSMWNLGVGIQSDRDKSNYRAYKDKKVYRVARNMSSGNQLFLELSQASGDNNTHGKFYTTTLGYKHFYKGYHDEERMNPYVALMLESWRGNLDLLAGNQLASGTEHKFVGAARFGIEYKLSEILNFELYYHHGGNTLTYKTKAGNSIKLENRRSSLGMGLNYEF